MDKLGKLREDFREWARVGRLCGSDKDFRRAVMELYHSEPEEWVWGSKQIDPIAREGVRACVDILYKAKADFDDVYFWSQRTK